METGETPSEELKRNFILSEWENYRHQDGLRWSRIQTIALSEAALMTGVYTTLSGITWTMKLVLALFLTATIALLGGLAEIDGRDADSHLRRALAMERTLGLPSYARPRRPLGLRGHRLLQIGFGMILLFDSLVIGDAARHLLSGHVARTVQAPR